MPFENVSYEFILEAREPIAHHQETVGNEALVMRRKVRQPTGRFSRVPYLTGNTLRHGMRVAASMAVLDAAGLLDGFGPELSQRALSLLFSGGILGGKGNTKAASITQYRELVDVFPPLALFGGCAGNRIIPGRLTVGEAMLVCDETAHLLPDWVLETAGVTTSARGHIEACTRVRMDPSLNPGRRQLLSGPEREAAEALLIASDEADGVVAKTKARSSMMPYSYETVAAGSLFFWRVSADTYSELDVDVFQVALAGFLYNARVGGKQGSGHGLIKAMAARNIKLASPADGASEVINPTGLAGPAGQRLRDHIAGRSEELTSWLRSSK